MEPNAHTRQRDLEGTPGWDTLDKRSSAFDAARVQMHGERRPPEVALFPLEAMPPRRRCRLSAMTKTARGGNLQARGA